MEVMEGNVYTLSVVSWVDVTERGIAGHLKSHSIYYGYGYSFFFHKAIIL